MDRQGVENGKMNVREFGYVIGIAMRLPKCQIMRMVRSSNERRRGTSFFHDVQGRKCKRVFMVMMINPQFLGGSWLSDDQKYT